MANNPLNQINQKFDVGVRADFFISMSGPDVQVLRDYFIGVQGTKIVLVEKYFEANLRNYSCSKFIDAKNKVVMPGLINGHTHLPMSFFKGLAEDIPFDEWLFKYILPLEGKLVSPEFVSDGTELSALELIRFGITTVCDMYYFVDKVAESLDRAGLRGVVGQTVIDLPSPDNKQNPELPYEILNKLKDKYPKGHRITPAIAPHAPYSCSDKTIGKAIEFSNLHKIPFVMHLAETKKEESDSQKKFGTSPTQRLKELGALSDRSIFAHGVHLDSSDVKSLVDAGSSIVHNPESNMKLGSGIAPISKYLAAGLKVGLGTDGVASNNNLNLFQEMDTAAKLQKVNSGDTMAITARKCLQMATIDGARALGLESQVGSLEVGKEADFIIVDLSAPHMFPHHDIPSLLVFTASGMEVEQVFCAGKILFEDGKYTTLDQHAILAKAEKWAKKIQDVLQG